MQEAFARGAVVLLRVLLALLLRSKKTVLGVGVLVLDRADAPVSLCVESGEHFDPGSPTFNSSSWPCHPRGLPNKAVYVRRKAVGKDVEEGAVLIVRHFYLAKNF